MSQQGFIQNYDTFTQDNEAPEMFHFWSAMSALSAIVSRRVGLSFDYFNIHPNLYIVLVGIPGSRKTTAMNIAKEFVYTIGDIPFSAECQTKQSICQDMALNCQKTYSNEKGEIVRYTPYTIFSTELSHFLGHASAKEMIDFLTTIWDAKFYDTKTKNKGNDLIMGPYLSMIACTTPDWIRSWMKEDVITGGFSRRAIFVYFTGKLKRIPSPKITPEMEKARDECIAWGKKLQNVSGYFTVTPEALKFYEEWYIKLQIPNDITGGYYESKHIQMFKVAMLISLSHSTNLVIDTIHLKLALLHLGKVEQNLLRVFQGIGRNELSAVAEKAKDIIITNGGVISESELKLILYRDASASEISEVFQHLMETGSARRFRTSVQGPVLWELLAPDASPAAPPMPAEPGQSSSQDSPNGERPPQSRDEAPPRLAPQDRALPIVPDKPAEP
jgi:Protein of unknown function (DUF3987)